jgi:hypothetical protein
MANHCRRWSKGRPMHGARTSMRRWSLEADQVARMCSVTGSSFLCWGLVRPGALGREPASHVGPPPGGARAGAALGPRAVRLHACGDAGSCHRCDSYAASMWSRARPKGSPRRDHRFALETPQGLVVEPVGEGQPARVLLAGDEDGERLPLDGRPWTSAISQSQMRRSDQDPASSRPGRTDAGAPARWWFSGLLFGFLC